MSGRSLYLPKYSKSHALVIGVNKYQNTGPLLHAYNDAKAVSGILIDRFGFPATNVQLLLDGDATRAAILKAFLKYADSNVIGPDDRILVFYAGHGHTLTGYHGEIGFLVPVDGDVDDLTSLIRWDELTRNADLMSAKHMLFLMDACYGGLALTRASIPSGSARFLKDMLQRYSRQVLTAGKADEVVADSGGTRSGHSIFTSHLLDGLEGSAVPAGGILTGHGLMAYVYEKVGSDTHSRQTPHFGFFDGDGDFIFDTSALASLETKSPTSTEPEPDRDFLIEAPTFSQPADPDTDTVAARLKGLIADPAGKIRLNDFISDLLRRAVRDLSQQNFPPSGTITPEEFAMRLQRYEKAVTDIQMAAILFAYWSTNDQIKLLERIFARIAEADKPVAGVAGWTRLSWYPVLLLMYSAGISALAAGRYDTLRAALLSPVHTNSRRAPEPIVLPTIVALTEIVEMFKLLPDMERKYVPRSEHVFKKLQPVLEDQLFLGQSYDDLFDQFEMLLALTFSDIRDENPEEHSWGPPGRFAWKERGRFSDDPVYSNFVAAVKGEGDRWKGIRAGLFRGSTKRFAAVADAYGRLLAQIPWW